MQLFSKPKLQEIRTLQDAEMKRESNALGLAVIEQTQKLNKLKEEYEHRKEEEEKQFVLFITETDRQRKDLIDQVKALEFRKLEALKPLNKEKELIRESHKMLEERFKFLHDEDSRLEGLNQDIVQEQKHIAASKKQHEKDVSIFEKEKAKFLKTYAAKVQEQEEVSLSIKTALSLIKIKEDGLVKLEKDLVNREKDLAAERDWLKKANKQMDNRERKLRLLEARLAKHQERLKA